MDSPKASPGSGGPQASPDPPATTFRRRLVLGFGLLVGAVLTVLLVVGAVLYRRTQEEAERRLQESLTAVLADSIERVAFSGKYHSRLFVEQVVRSQPSLAFVAVSDRDGRYLAHSDPTRNGMLLAPDHRLIAQRVTASGETAVTDSEHLGTSIRLIARPFRSGYENQLTGVILVGIGTQESLAAFRRTQLYLIALVVALALLALVATRYLSGIFAGPVESMARQLSGILTHAPWLISIADGEGEVVESSASFRELEPRASGLLEEEIRGTLRRGRPIERELDHCIGGEARTFRSITFPIERSSRGKVTRVCAIAEDMTERKRAEQALRESEQQHAITLDSIGDAVIATDASGVITRMNPVASQMTGFGTSEAIGMPLTDVLRRLDPRSRELLSPDVEELLRGAAGRDVHRRSLLVGQGGVETLVAESVAPILDAQGRVAGAVLAFRDVSREAALEEELRQSEKMMAVGQLAGGVAHDFNNLLTGILGNAQLLRMRASSAADVHRRADGIITAATRATDLVGKLLAYSRKGPLRSEAVDIHGTILEVAHLLGHTLDRRIRILKDFTAELSFVRGDPSQLQSALLNLAVNARDAMPDGGELRFATRNVHLDAGALRQYSERVEPGPFVEISVTDTGVGMSPELLRRIFEPFFTTKGPGEGTGLGLASVYGCVQAHHGLVTVYSEPGVGTTFRVLLPQDEGAAIAEHPKAPAPPTPGSGRILLVDDEEVLRDLARDALEGLGYCVAVCVDGTEGQAYFVEHHLELDLVILDLIMPRQGGEETLHAMREIDPQVPVLLVSGFSGGLTTDGLLDAGACGFLQKPFSVPQLAAAVARHVRVASARARP